MTSPASKRRIIVSFRPSFNDVLAIANKKVKVIQVTNAAPNNSLSDNSRNIISNYGIEFPVQMSRIEEKIPYHLTYMFIIRQDQIYTTMAEIMMIKYGDVK